MNKQNNTAAISNTESSSMALEQDSESEVSSPDIGGVFVPPINHTNLNFQRPVYHRKTKRDFTKYEDDPRLSKYVRRIEEIHELERQRTRDSRTAWWWDRGIQLVILFLTIISATCSVISILLQS